MRWTFPGLFLNQTPLQRCNQRMQWNQVDHLAIFSVESVALCSISATRDSIIWNGITTKQPTSLPNLLNPLVLHKFGKELLHHCHILFSPQTPYRLCVLEPMLLYLVVLPFLVVGWMKFYWRIKKKKKNLLHPISRYNTQKLGIYHNKKNLAWLLSSAFC